MDDVIKGLIVSQCFIQTRRAPILVVAHTNKMLRCLLLDKNFKI